MKTENRGGKRPNSGRPQEGKKKAIYIKVPIEYFDELNKACRELVRKHVAQHKKTVV
jgi:hypothetical protein